jgi:hypothetical protein
MHYFFYILYQLYSNTTAKGADVTANASTIGSNTVAAAYGANMGAAAKTIGADMGATTNRTSMAADTLWCWGSESPVLMLFL